jgi:hypothetical protein
MGSSPFQSKSSVTGANTATGSIIPIDDNKITRAEFALAMVEEGIVQTDEDGYLVVNGVLVRGDTASSLTATVLGVNEIAYATDTHEIFASKNTGSDEPGGYRFGTYKLTNPTTVNGASYQLPYAPDLYVYDADLTTLPTNNYDHVFAFAADTSYGIGDRLRIYIYKSTGKTLVGQYLLINDDGAGNQFLFMQDGTLYNYNPTAYSINATAEENIYLDLEVGAFEGSNPIWVVKQMFGCEIAAVL